MVNNICAIIPAAGVGERMEGHAGVPKQFLPINGKPLITYTVESFLKLEWIEKIIVVVAPEKIKEVNKLFQCMAMDIEKVTVVGGSTTRNRSILSAFRFIESESKNWNTQFDVVIIHDGVRPFVDENILDEVVKAAEKYGGAGVICPLTSTVISVDESNFLKFCFDRNKLRASEMPQAFRFSVAFNAYINCTEEELEYGTECLKVVQDYADNSTMDIYIKLIRGTTDTWKVTYHKDLYAVQYIAKEKEAVDIIGRQESSPLLITCLKEALLKKFKKVEGPSLTPKDSIPNHVIIHESTNLPELILHEEEHSHKEERSGHHKTVNICFNNSAIDVSKLVEEAKRVAIEKGENVKTYYVVSKEDPSKKLATEMAGLVTALLFDSCEELDGNIFFC